MIIRAISESWDLREHNKEQEHLRGVCHLLVTSLNITFYINIARQGNNFRLGKSNHIKYMELKMSQYPLNASNNGTLGGYIQPHAMLFEQVN